MKVKKFSKQYKTPRKILEYIPQAPDTLLRKAEPPTWTKCDDGRPCAKKCASVS